MHTLRNPDGALRYASVDGITFACIRSGVEHPQMCIVTGFRENMRTHEQTYDAIIARLGRPEDVDLSLVQIEAMLHAFHALPPPAAPCEFAHAIAADSTVTVKRMAKPNAAADDAQVALMEAQERERQLAEQPTEAELRAMTTTLVAGILASRDSLGNAALFDVGADEFQVNKARRRLATVAVKIARAIIDTAKER